MHMLTRFTQRALTLAFAVTLALGIAGCGAEPKERQRFIDFLQTRIVNKPGLHVPALSLAEEKSFGQYSKHFAVIRDFNGSLETKVSGPLRQLLDHGMPRDVPDLMEGKTDLAAVRRASALLRANIDAELAKADARRAGLKQADDVKLVYDKAYTRSVTVPAVLIKEILPPLAAALDSADKLSTFFATHKGKISFRGGLLEVPDPDILRQANALIGELNAHSRDVMAAQRRFNAMATGD